MHFHGRLFGVQHGQDRGVLLSVDEFDAEDFGGGKGRVYGDLGRDGRFPGILLGSESLIFQFVWIGL